MGQTPGAAQSKGHPKPMKGRARPDGPRRIVYVLGSTRSGTSALRAALSQTRYKGYGESHMEPLLTGVVEAVRAHKAAADPALGNAWSRFDADALSRHLIAGYEAWLAETVQSDYLIDKTPTLRAIRAAPMLNRLHADPAFLFCARRHVDNVLSKRKKFPKMGFDAACREWVACNRAWRRVRAELGGNYLEFDFHDLAADPAVIAGRIGDYLGMARPRERARMADFLIAQRPQGAPARDLTRYCKLSETGWNAAEQARFREICGPLGAEMGYGYDHYFDPAAAPSDPAAGRPDRAKEI